MTSWTGRVRSWGGREARAPGVAMVLAAIAGCATRDDAPPPPVQGGALAPHVISDQVHSQGHTGFFWLPPLVAAPELQGTFDASQEPTVTITPLSPPNAAPIATFTMTSGPGSETIRVDPTSQNYIVNFHTDQFSLDPTIDYRVAVIIGGRTVGFLDVDVVTSQSQAKNVDTSQYVALVDGKTLPIKWFINACGSVFCSALDQCHAVGSCDYQTGTCSNPPDPDGTTCNDGNACTQKDACSAGTCVGGDPVTCVAEDDCHVAGTCDPASGTCSNPDAADGTTCSTAGFTSDGSCEAGACIAYTVGGTLSGIANLANIVLQNDGGDDLSVSANGAFTFHTPLPPGASYAVTIKTPASSGQSCSVGNGSGTVSGNVTGVSVTCSPLLVTLASGQASPDGIASDGNNVYWVEFTGAGRVESVPVGGGPVTVLASNQASPRRVAVDGSNVYWSNSGGTIVQTPIGGGALTTVATNQASPYGIALDASYVYWTDLNDNRVMRAPIGGGAATAIASSSGPLDITVDATSAYWTDLGGTVMKAPIGGGAATTLAFGLVVIGGYWDGIAADANNVYWVDSGTGTVQKTPKAGGATTTLAANQAGPTNIATDGINVYWPDGNGETIMRAPVGGGPVTTLARFQSGPFRIAVDATSVYWTDSGNGTVMKLTPK